MEYIILQERYRIKNKDKVDVFPYEWFYFGDYEIKKTILEECLKYDILIKESTYYLEFRKKALNKNI